MRFLLTLILVAWAMPAGAQISAGPTGGLALVDDNGKLMGGLEVEVFYPDPLVILNTPQGSGFVGIDVAYNGFSRAPARDVYFPTANCTGQAYSDNQYIPALNGVVLVLGSDLTTLYASTGPKVSVALASRIDNTGSCQPSSGTADYFPVTEVGDLAAEFTPPFHIVTVASQQSASVPMQIGWLLGGLLLGLGVKRAVGR